MRGTRLFDKAHAAVYLHAGFSHGDAHVCAEGLGDRCQEGRPRLPLRLTGGIAHVDGMSAGQRDGPGRENVGLHGHEHAAHIGVVHNGACAVLARAALLAVERIFQRVLIGGFGRADALFPDAEPGVVHHGEHRGHAALFLADDPSLGVIVLHDGGGGAVQAHLVFEADDTHAVALARVAILIRQEFRHEEEADAFRPRRRTG